MATGYGNSRVLPLNCSSAFPYVFGARHGKWWCQAVPHYSYAALASALSERVGHRGLSFTALIVDWYPT